MEKEKDGVWRTIRGRRIFIGKGESLGEAMSKSGKFSRDSLRQDKDIIRYKERSSRFGKNDKLDRKSNNKIVSKNSNTSIDYWYNRNNQAPKNRINENEPQRVGNTRVEKNYFRYSEADRRELSHEKIQKKLADYKEKVEHQDDEEALKSWSRYRDKYQKSLDRATNPESKKRFMSERDMAQKEIDKIREYQAKKQSNNKIETSSERQEYEKIKDKYGRGSKEERKAYFSLSNEERGKMMNEQMDKRLAKIKEKEQSNNKVETWEEKVKRLEKENAKNKNYEIPKQSNNKADPYNDPESEESQRLQSIQSRYDEYLQDTEGRGASYGEIAYVDSLRGKDLDDFEKELDDYETKKYGKQETIKAFKEKKQSNRKTATEIKDGKAIRNENAPITKYNDYNKNEEKYRENLSREIAKELNASMKYASENKLEKEAGSIRSYVDGEVLSKGEKPYTNIYGGLERSTKSLENWLKRLKKGK